MADREQSLGRPQAPAADMQAADAASPRHSGIGARIRFLRAQHQMTLDALAAKTGLTKSFLSKVERGLSVPSISTAMKVAGSLNLTVGQLLGEAQYDDAISIVRASGRPSFMARAAREGYDYQLLAAAKRFKAMEPYIMRPPREFQDARRFDHPGQELFFVLSGTIELQYGDQSFILDDGDCAYFDAHVPHRSRALGERPAEVLVVVSATF